MTEVLQCVERKVFVIHIQEDLIPLIWLLQIYVGYDTGYKSVIRATHSVYDDEK